MRLLLTGCSLGILLVAPVLHSAARGPSASVPVIVERVDSPGAFVAGLTAEDFEVRLNGRSRSIEGLSSGQSGVVVLLLVDMSFSATTGTPKEGGPWSRGGHDWSGLLRGIERALLPRLRPIDLFIVGAFAGRRVWFGPALSDRTTDASVVSSVLNLKAVDGADWFGPSPIWDAVTWATDVLAAHQGIRAIVLVTDGLATGNRRSMSEAAAAAAAHGVQVHAVYEQAAAAPKASLRPGATGDVLLRMLAGRTGGVFRHDTRYTQTSWREPTPPFAEIVDAIQHTYVLTVSLDESEAYGGALGVRMKLSGLRVYAPYSLGADTATR